MAYKQRPTWRPTKEQALAFFATYDGCLITREQIRAAFPDAPVQPMLTWACRMGVIATQKRQYRITEPQIRLLLQRYDGTEGALDTLMPHFPAVSRTTVKRWAAELGLTRRKEPPWTPEELAYLRDHLGNSSFKAMAAHLHRSIIAVRVKAKRLHLSTRRDGYSVHDLAEAFGEDHKIIERWIEKGWLRGHKKDSELSAPTKTFWIFTDAAVAAFIVRHPDEIDPRRLHRTGAWLWFVDLLANGGRGLGELTQEGLERVG